MLLRSIRCFKPTLLQYSAARTSLSRDIAQETRNLSVCSAGMMNPSRRFSTLEEDSDDELTRTVLVLGSSGALGSSVANHLLQRGVTVIGADILELPADFGYELNGFISLQPNGDLKRLTKDLSSGIKLALENEKQNGLDAIICANGGWQGDPPPPSQQASSLRTSMDVADEDEWQQEIERNAVEYATVVESMMHKNLYPCVAAAFAAQHYLNPGSLMVAIGATAALSPTPGMLGYGLAKAATHHLVRTLGASTGKSLDSKSIRKQGRSVRRQLPALDELSVVGILPTTIDTPMNRKNNPKANFDEWTKPTDIAREIGSWIENAHLRPHSGSLVKVHPYDGEAVFELVR